MWTNDPQLASWPGARKGRPAHGREHPARLPVQALLAFAPGDLPVQLLTSCKRCGQVVHVISGRFDLDVHGCAAPALAELRGDTNSAMLMLLLLLHPQQAVGEEVRGIEDGLLADLSCSSWLCQNELRTAAWATVSEQSLCRSVPVEQFGSAQPSIASVAAPMPVQMANNVVVMSIPTMHQAQPIMQPLVQLFTGNPAARPEDESWSWMGVPVGSFGGNPICMQQLGLAVALLAKPPTIETMWSGPVAELQQQHLVVPISMFSVLK
eukprot:CAMPEP_0206426816 /NCGR_PEP_ID=MMETSP0324_2-20121206/4629_1 /ASSEMBLY_ACC=CAM_ASM_000836 /TAXON_ID=2866 /ORGANISM="Crypthecodinium cohnii, Strain Seligo" /LENGTH=265 /DNA_ID=CAMNT_0053891895 /DNA_START=392 /DNA_END=1189 /DNA_ORIENTATION=+